MIIASYGKTLSNPVKQIKKDQQVQAILSILIELWIIPFSRYFNRIEFSWSIYDTEDGCLAGLF